MAGEECVRPTPKDLGVKGPEAPVTQNTPRPDSSRSGWETMLGGQVGGEFTVRTLQSYRKSPDVWCYFFTNPNL